MMISSIFLEVSASVMDPVTWLCLLGGVIGGILVGAMPGLSATMGVALLVPFTFGLSIMPAISMLIGIYYGAVFGGSITAILIRTPGTPASAATTLDGFPLTQKGEGGRALAVAATAALVGGAIGAVFLMALAPQISSFALRFGPTEYFALAVLGLTLIVSVSGGSLLKGGAVAVFGLLLATVGLDPMTGYPRFIFGSVSLMEGMSFIPVMIGLFAIAEVLRGVGEGRKKAEESADNGHPTLISKADFKATYPTMIKAGVTGTFVGSTPGAGSDIAAFISYGMAKRQARDPEQFGRGDIRGVAAPEAAKTASTSGAMVPLLSLGVPGDSVTAVLIGAFVIHGLQPGPLLFKDHAGLVYSIFAVVLLAHVLVFAAASLGARHFVRVVQIDRRFLYPVILLLSVVGAFAMRNNPFDIWLAIAFGIIGYFLQGRGYPVAPLLLALILGPMAEENFRRALVLSEGSLGIFIRSPITVALLGIAVIAVGTALWRGRRRGVARVPL